MLPPSFRRFYDRNRRRKPLVAPLPNGRIISRNQVKLSTVSSTLRPVFLFLVLSPPTSSRRLYQRFLHPTFDSLSFSSPPFFIPFLQMTVFSNSGSSSLEVIPRKDLREKEFPYIHRISTVAGANKRIISDPELPVVREAGASVRVILGESLLAIVSVVKGGQGAFSRNERSSKFEFSAETGLCWPLKCPGNIPFPLRITFVLFCPISLSTGCFCVTPRRFSLLPLPLFLFNFLYFLSSYSFSLFFSFLFFLFFFYRSAHNH